MWQALFLSHQFPSTDNARQNKLRRAKLSYPKESALGTQSPLKAADMKNGQLVVLALLVAACVTHIAAERKLDSFVYWQQTWSRGVKIE